MHIYVALLFLAFISLPGLLSAQEKPPLYNDLLDSVTVTGQRQASGSATRTTLLGDDLEKVQGGSLARMIRSIPGVTMFQTGATINKPVIHGMHSNRILILNNGIRQEGQQWGAEHAPEIDPFTAGRISILKGSETIRFGPGAAGGVVIVEPPALPVRPGLHAELNLAGTDNGKSVALSGMLSGGVSRLPGLGWRVQGSFKRAGNIRTADYYLENTGIRELNFSAAAGYSNKKLTAELYFSRFNTGLGIFEGAHIGNLSDLQARIENGRPGEKGTFSYTIGIPRQQVSHNLLKLKGQLLLAGGLKFSLQYGIQLNRRREYDIRRGGRNGIPSMDLGLITQTLDAFLEKFTGSWKNILGMTGLVQVNNTASGTFATPLIPNFDSYGTGLYLIRKLIKPHYELEAGLRYDYKRMDALGYDKNLNFYGGNREFHNLSASAGGIWRLNEHWQVRSNMGLAWRPPTVNELYSKGLHHGTASYETGDSRLESEQSYKWISTIKYDGSALRAELDLYSHWFKNYIYLNPALEYITTMQGSFPTFNYEQTPARFSGIDITGNYLISKNFEYELKGSLVRAKDLSHESYLPWIPSDRISGSLRWNFGLRSKSQPVYVQLQHEYVARQTRYTAGTDFASPPAAYHLWHLNTGTGWETGNHSLSLNLSVNNLSNTLYREYMNRFRYYAHDTGRNITFRMTYKF